MNLNQITISSNKVVESVQFYKKLGLVLIVDSIPRYCRFECSNGATFSIHETIETPENNSIVIYFECENLDVKVAELKEQGIEFETEPTDQRWLWREAYLKDPNGNQICLFYAGENRLNPPWRIKS
jgi:predicted enzyme related to lactoylglutathione lyase